MRSCFLARFATAAVFTALLSLPAHATSYASIVVYGDSLSDNGNLYAATGGLAPTSPYVNGRFSNGPVAVEQLAAQLNTPLLDFAFGGATTGIGNIGDYGTPTSPGYAGLPGMTAELGISAGKIPSSYLPNSLFIVWGGADDFEALFEPQLPTPTLSDILAAATGAATNIDNIVLKLQGEGATSILVPNLPNLGGTPEFGINTPLNGAAVAYSNTFNAALAATLPSGATLFDTNALFNSLLLQPQNYGLSNTTNECILDGANPACTGYLFFDDIHPTTAVDSILASQFAAAVAPTPEPSSLLLLGSGALGFVGVLRRRRLA